MRTLAFNACTAMLFFPPFLPSSLLAPVYWNKKVRRGENRKKDEKRSKWLYFTKDSKRVEEPKFLQGIRGVQTARYYQSRKESV